MHEVYVGVGSNLGDKLQYLASVFRQLRGSRTILVKEISGIYETEPVGIKGQPPFLNAAVRIETTLDPLELLENLKSLEEKLGRRQRARWGPREIDIDILLYDDLVLHEPRLTIPHAEMRNRRFVLQPLAEIAADAVHPVLHDSIGTLLERCADTSRVERSAELTESFHLLVKA